MSMKQEVVGVFMLFVVARSSQSTGCNHPPARARTSAASWPGGRIHERSK